MDKSPIFKEFQVFGPGNYQDVGTSIEQGARPPTMRELAPLVRDAFAIDDVVKNHIPQTFGENFISDLVQTQKVLRNGVIISSTHNLFLPGKGVYIDDKPNFVDGNPSMRESDLVRRVRQKDRSVRFVPHGFKTGSMKAAKFAENPYVTALVGREAAECLASAAMRQYGLCFIMPPSKEYIGVSTVAFKFGHLVLNYKSLVYQEIKYLAATNEPATLNRFRRFLYRSRYNAGVYLIASDTRYRKFYSFPLEKKSKR